MNDERICSYDGLTLFVRDPNFRQAVLKNSGRYQLKGNYDYEMKRLTGAFTGKFRNFDIYTAANSLGRGIVLGGSVHKWKNGEFNYDAFTWREFEQVYKDILDEFKFDPKQTDMWELESGLNIVLPKEWEYSAKEIVQNTILLKGDSKSWLEKKQKNGGFSLHVEKGESKVKMYDKGRQFNLGYELLRPEWVGKKRPLETTGIFCFEDLLDYKNHLKISHRLLKEFKTLLLFQPEILDNPSLSAEEKLFLLTFNNGNAWINLRRQSDSQYQINRKKYLLLIDQYCAVNYQKKLLELMHQQIL